MNLGCTSKWFDGAQTRGETHQMLRDSTKIFYLFIYLFFGKKFEGN